MSFPSQDDVHKDRYLSLLENIPDVITRWSQDLVLLYANSALEKITGVSNSTLLGKNRSQMGQPDDVILPSVASLRKAFETGEAVEHLHSFLTPEGEACFQWRLVPEKNGRGEVETLVAIARDITEQKHAEQALREANSAATQSEERLQRVLETDAVGMLFFDYNGTVLQANDVFLRMTGYPQEQIDDRELSWRKMTPPEWIAESEAQMEQFRQTGRIGPYEKEYFLADGSRRWMLFAGRDLGDGTIAEYCMDITDRKHAEVALRESEEKYRAIFNSINEGFSLLDIQFDENGQAYDVIIRDANPAQDRVDGVQALIGGRVREFLPDIEMKWIERYAKIARSGEPEHFEDWSEANQRWYEVAGSRVGGPGSSLVAIVYNDITERKKVDKVLREHQKQLQLLNETLEQKVEEKTTEVRRLASDLIKVTQLERLRMSHVLHDELQQRLYAILMQLSFLREEFPAENETFQKEASDFEDTLREILKIKLHAI